MEENDMKPVHVVVILLAVVVVGYGAYTFMRPEPAQDLTPEPSPSPEPKPEPELVPSLESRTYSVSILLETGTMEVEKEYNFTVRFVSNGYEGDVSITPIKYWSSSSQDLYLQFRTEAFSEHFLRRNETIEIPGTIKWTGKLYTDSEFFLTIYTNPHLGVRCSGHIIVKGVPKPKAVIVSWRNVEPEKRNQIYLIFDTEDDYYKFDYFVTREYNKTLEVEAWELESGVKLGIEGMDMQCGVNFRIFNASGKEVFNKTITEKGEIVEYILREEDIT